MKIRSITYFLNPGWPLEGKRLGKAGNFINAARPAFQEAGFEVQTASEGRAAQTHLSDEDYDVSVSDLGMPGMDGFALLEWMQTHASDVASV